MILRIECDQVSEKIQAFKLLRILGKIGLKEAKALIEGLSESPNGNGVLALTGTLRVKVDPVFALGHLLEALNAPAYTPALSALSPVPDGVTITVEAPRVALIDLSDQA